MAIDDAERIRCRVEQAEKFVSELERRLLDYGDVAAERDRVRDKMTAGLAMLNAMKAKQTDAFNELISAHERMARECEAQREQLAAAQERNDCLRCQLDQLHERFDKQETAVRELESRRAALLDEAESLEKQRADAAALTDRFREMRRGAESELRVQDERLAGLQTALADKIAEHARLEAAVTAEQDRGECVRASIGELKADGDRAARALRAEIAELRGRCDERAADAASLRRRLDEKRDEAADVGGRTAELKRAIKELRDAYYRDKGRADKELADARSEVKRLSAELETIAARLCDARTAGAQIECRVREQRDAIERSESAREKLRREVNSIRETAFATAEAMRAECEQRDRDKAVAERELELKAQEECRLQRLVRGQAGQIRRLRTETSVAAAALSRRGEPFPWPACDGAAAETVGGASEGCARSERARLECAE